MPNNAQRLVPGKGYYPGAECIVAIPPEYPTGYDTSKVNGLIVVLLHIVGWRGTYTCVNCNTPWIRIPGTTGTFWNCKRKDGQLLDMDCQFARFPFRQQHLIPIGGTELLADDSIGNKLATKERNKAIDLFISFIEPNSNF